MKITTVLSRFCGLLSRFGIGFARSFRGATTGILGDFSWHPPRWLKQFGESWGRIERAYPRMVAPVIVALFFVSCGAAWTWNWYEHRPKPRRVTIKISPIAVTKLEKTLTFPALAIYFSEPAARLEDLHKASLKGIRLQPEIAG